MSSNNFTMSLRTHGVHSLTSLMKPIVKRFDKSRYGRRMRWLVVPLLCLLFDQAVIAEEITIQIGTLPGLRYDMKRFDVRPGDKVKLVFSNQDTMLHNLVIVTPGSRVEIISAALTLGAKAIEKHYVPDSPKVLWATDVVASGESFTLEFTAPSETGEYPYVCTYPGHGFLMYGTMRVSDTLEKPEMNTGPVVAQTSHQHHDDGAILKRAFMPHSGPASIAVRLPGGHSYCWDAGACHLRYAWKGGFVESVYRKPEKLLGEIYYRESHNFPFRLGNKKPEPPNKFQFLGYALDASGIPEFEYEADGIHIFERIEVREDRLVRRFRTAAEGPVDLWYPIDPSQASRLDSTGQLTGNFYRFSGKDAVEFYVTLSPSS